MINHSQQSNNFNTFNASSNFNDSTTTFAETILSQSISDDISNSSSGFVRQHQQHRTARKSRINAAASAAIKSSKKQETQPKQQEQTQETEEEEEEEQQQTKIGCKAWKTASRSAKSMSKHSNIVNADMERQIPRFRSNEIMLGKLLGNGGFNCVHEVCNINLQDKNDKTLPYANKVSSKLQIEKRTLVANHCNLRNRSRTSNNNNNIIKQSYNRYAIKFLSKETIDDETNFVIGATDLVIEAKFLASLDHPNIIKLRGMSASGTQGFATSKIMGYFLLLDYLSNTLESQINVGWKNYAIKRNYYNNPNKLSNSSSSRKNNHMIESRGFTSASASLLKGINKEMSTKEKDFMAERLHIAYDISSAVKYLHKKNIIFRDLKPDNVGFDQNGTMKLFDFGLAKELDPRKLVGDDMYKMSGNTGSRRYMSPEVANHEPYTLSADVYSFGLMVWQMLSLEIPFDGMTTQYHQDYILDGDERPMLFNAWSSNICMLLSRCWESKPNDRLSMSSCCKILQHEVITLRDGNDTGFVNVNTTRQTTRTSASTNTSTATTNTTKSSSSPTTSTSRRSSSSSTATRRKSSSSNSANIDTTDKRKSIDKTNVELAKAVNSLERSNEGAMAA